MKRPVRRELHDKQDREDILIPTTCSYVQESEPTLPATTIQQWICLDLSAELDSVPSKSTRPIRQPENTESCPRGSLLKVELIGTDRGVRLFPPTEDGTQDNIRQRDRKHRNNHPLSRTAERLPRRCRRRRWEARSELCPVKQHGIT